MVAPSPPPAFPPPADLRAELAAAAAALTDHALLAPAKWAAEMLAGLPPSCRDGPPSPAPSLHHPPLPPAEADALALATPLLGLREYARAAHALAGCSHPRPAFLRAWALYMGGEASRAAALAGETARGGLGGPPPHADNDALPAVEADLATQAGPFPDYLRGVVAADRGDAAAARGALLASLRAFPLNWGAWLALAALDAAERGGGAGAGPSGAAAAAAVAAASPHGGLPPHWASSAYLAHVAVDAADAPDALARLEPLAAAFPAGSWVRSNAAAAHYAARNFDEAATLYAASLAADPHRLDGLDTYSNVLYVREDGPALSLLARAAAATDPFSPVAAAIAGNYASLRGDHAAAVAAFKRALALDPRAGSAWTLMGHEFVELKNPAAAVAAYRRAVAASPRDHRAWYGLGQAYELLHLPAYALHYFKRAAALRPSDARMWVAVGQCAEAARGGIVGSRAAAAATTAAAKRAYRRALAAGDAEGVALRRLARLHEADGDDDDAAACHAAALAAADRAAAEGGDGEGALGPDAVDALVFLAAYHRARGDAAAADAAEGRLLDAGGGGGGGGGGAGGGGLLREGATLKARVAAWLSAAARRCCCGAGPPAVAPADAPPPPPIEKEGVAHPRATGAGLGTVEVEPAGPSVPHLPPAPTTTAPSTDAVWAAVVQLRHAQAKLAAVKRLAGGARTVAVVVASVREGARREEVGYVAGSRPLPHVSHPSDLPLDLVLAIASHLERKQDVVNMARVCSGWKAALYASPSPLFHSVSVKMNHLINFATPLPMATRLQARGAEIRSLTLHDVTSDTDHALVARLVASMPRLQSLTIKIKMPCWRSRVTWNDAWLHQISRAAGAHCALTHFAVKIYGHGPEDQTMRCPSLIFTALGDAALGRITSITFYGNGMDVTGPRHGDWLSHAVNLRSIHWGTGPGELSLPQLPASLTALRDVAIEGVETLPPASTTPALAHVERVKVTSCGENVASNILARLNAVTRLEVNEQGRPWLASFSTLRSLRELHWHCDGPCPDAVATLPSLTSLWASPLSAFTAPDNGVAYPALRELRVGRWPQGSHVPVLGTNFAPRLRKLKIMHGDLDMAAVARWDATALEELELVDVNLCVAPEPGWVEGDLHPGDVAALGLPAALPALKSVVIYLQVRPKDAHAEKAAQVLFSFGGYCKRHRTWDYT